MNHLDFSRLKQEVQREKEHQEVLDATSRESSSSLSARKPTSASNSSFHSNEIETGTNWNENFGKEVEEEVEEYKPSVQSSPNKQTSSQRRARFYLNKNTQSISNTYNIYSTTSTTRRINKKIPYLSRSNCQSGTLVSKCKQAKRKASPFGSLNLLSASLCQLESMRNERLVCDQDDPSYEEKRMQMRTDNSSLYYKSYFKYKSDSNRNVQIVNYDEVDEKIDRHPALVWTQQRCKFKSRSIDFLDEHPSQTSKQLTYKRNKRYSTNDLMSFEDIPNELSNLKPMNENKQWSQAKMSRERRKGLYKPNENALTIKKKKEYRTSVSRCLSPPPPTGFISPYGLLAPPPPPSTISNLNAQSASSLSQRALIPHLS